MEQETIVLALTRKIISFDDANKMLSSFERSLNRRCSEFGTVVLKSILSYKGSSPKLYYLFELSITDKKKYHIAKLKSTTTYATITKLNSHYLRIEDELNNPKFMDISGLL